jgi:RNA polymerase sigma-70 factor (ECF subfamily)
MTNCDDLINSAKKGDTYAFQCLIQRCKGLVMVIARAIVGYESAEDVTQDVCVKLHKDLATIQSTSHLERWLRAVARTTSVDHLRRRRPDEITTNIDDSSGEGRDEPSSEVSETESLSSHHYQPVSRSENDRKLIKLAKEKVQARMSASDWRVIELRPYLSLEKIAEETGLNINRVRKIIATFQEEFTNEFGPIFGKSKAKRTAGTTGD